MIYEYDKKYLREHYHGNMAQMRYIGDTFNWTPERIKAAFNYGHGTIKDLRVYMENNTKYCIFEER